MYRRLTTLLLQVMAEVSLIQFALVISLLACTEAQLRKYDIGLGNLRIEDFTGRHIVLMGDSVTRYQYLSLVYFLEYGAFPGNEDTWLTPEGAQLKGPTWEKSYTSWEQFYNVTNGQLRGHEICDCFRARETKTTLCENRYYHHPSLNISVSYVGWMGPIPIRGHLLPGGHGAGPVAAASPSETYNAMGCRVSNCNNPYKWNARSPQDAIRAHVKGLSPTDFFANAGLWPIEGINWIGLAAAGRDLHISTGANIFWKTTTPEINEHQKGCKSVHRLKHGEIREMAQNGWHLYDAFKIVCNLQGSIYTDKLHFQGVAYEELNRQLFWHIDLARKGELFRIREENLHTLPAGGAGQKSITAAPPKKRRKSRRRRTTKKKRGM